jgi:rSAM/selenodomain-associated transferase 1
MPTYVDGLAVMAKAPDAGMVKTRLVPPLTITQAAELYRALLLDQLDHLATLPAVDLYVSYTPAAASALFEGLVPREYRCFPQPSGDLGARMEHCCAELWRRGHSSAILLGSDLPPVPAGIIKQACSSLAPAKSRVVLGPSRDGGYYLIGLNQPTPEIFRGMIWSQPRVLSETLERLFRLGIEAYILPEWFDVDTAEDLDRLYRINEPAVRAAMGRTRAWLDSVNRCASGNS